MTTPAASKPAPTPSQPTNIPAPANSDAPSTGGGDASGGSSYTAGIACEQDGQWNCIGGKQFQRCASGRWSPAMAMAAGTSCSPGLTMNMAIV